ncbi:hypothetical protein [Stutzerimonas stutzeri]|uniref:hypothetical protein n=1 Tax=Stutzerimonas stutzeri TaxID=316 RepID=UPI0018EED9F6|nr:hypothetical protein [Stutzerimonas stutzeri]
MFHLNLMVVLLILSFLLMGTGFNFREQPWGLALLGLGILTIGSALLYKLQMTFG